VFKLIIDSNVLQTIVAVLVLQSMCIVFAGFMMIRMTHELYKFKRTFDEKIVVVLKEDKIPKQTFDYTDTDMENKDVNSMYPKHYEKEWRKYD
jgi:aldehyde:ferredoxin oxidoreductase